LAKEPFFAKVVTVVFRKVPQKNWGFQAAELGLNPNAVAGVPDEAFFHEPGESQFIRFCFAKEDKELDEACRRLERLKINRGD